MSICLVAACDTSPHSYSVEYVADGFTDEMDVAFVAPQGVPAEDDTLFVPGDSTFTEGDTTFVQGVEPTWRLRFEAEESQSVFLRVENLGDGGHVSAIVYVNDDFFGSDGSNDSVKVATVSGNL